MPTTPSPVIHVSPVRWRLKNGPRREASSEVQLHGEAKCNHTDARTNA